jgi:hypothetical protein
MADHGSSIEKILISVSEYERLKEIEQKYLNLQNSPGQNITVKVQNSYHSCRLNITVKMQNSYHLT